MTVLRAGTATDVGRVRNTNQDRLIAEENLFAVADGMGGHVGGEVAAGLAVEALAAAFQQDASVSGLRHAVAVANGAVWHRSQHDDDLRGMGTTLTAAALTVGSDGRDVLGLANVGDSRAYLLSDGRVAQITADHSLAEEKVRQGELTEAEAAVHPHRHILTRALGVTPDVDVDLWEVHVRTGDRLLLCSDGLSNEVDTPAIARILSSVRDPRRAARALVKAANDHGGGDNISVVVVDVLVGEDRVDGSTYVTQVPAPGPVPAPPQVPTPASPPPPGPGSPASAAPGGSLVDTMARPGTDLFVAAPPPPGAPRAPLVDRGPPASDEEGSESRRDRRQRLGIPRRITLRVVLFCLLTLAVPTAAYEVLHWYATDNWYVTVHDGHLAIYQGRPGGMLWFQPKLVQETAVATTQVLPDRLPDLRARVEETSLAGARRYVKNLADEFSAQQQLGNPAAAGSPATGVSP
ncbi:MAG TPA: Stp1/IreP family PP2C-type Ser/Thr phosphatase [Acidimicrobiales bacterium]|nr:Stp1/IreP family PP2C-type Ser/Thr phosphatase [Acidimicrobiales bacterium]